MIITLCSSVKRRWTWPYVVLVDGHIAEIGTHEELERNGGDFWSLFLAQGAHPPA